MKIMENLEKESNPSIHLQTSFHIDVHLFLRLLFSKGTESAYKFSAELPTMTIRMQ